MKIDINDNMYQKKINTLLENNIWISSLQNLNDSFEGIALYWDEELLKSKKWDLNLFDYFHSLNSNVSICSFTEDGAHNQLLWSYYTNNEGKIGRAHV